MNCAQLQQLQEQARRLHQELESRRRAARAVASKLDSGAASGSHDYEWFLERKLHRAAAAIQQHLGHHNCQS